jgi:hypothetical protein
VRTAVLRLLAVLFVGTAAPMSAQQPANEDCQACHEDPAAARADGTSVGVDARAFAGSVHGVLACVDCHQDLSAQTDWPHPDRLSAVSCAGCHDDAVAAYAAGIHAAARRGEPGRPAAACADCHGTHDIRPSADAASRTHHASLPATCGGCHGDADLIRREGIEAGNVAAAFQDSIHGRALSRSGLNVAPNCGDCHGSHDIRRATVAESRVHRLNVPATCGGCHEGIERQYRAGIHGERLAAGDAGAPTCADCHSAHSITRIDAAGFQLDVVRECGTCHRDQIQTYRDTFHGQVTALGFERIAKCADCHAAHEVLPKSHPASMVSDANLVNTCSRCHQTVNASFVRYDPHPDPDDYDRNPVLWWVNRFYTVLIAGCFTFFGLHSLLWFWRSWREGATPE